MNEKGSPGDVEPRFHRSKLNVNRQQIQPAEYGASNSPGQDGPNPTVKPPCHQPRVPVWRLRINYGGRKRNSSEFIRTVQAFVSKAFARTQLAFVFSVKFPSLVSDDRRQPSDTRQRSLRVLPPVVKQGSEFF